MMNLKKNITLFSLLLTCAMLLTSVSAQAAVFGGTHPVFEPEEGEDFPSTGDAVMTFDGPNLFLKKPASESKTHWNNQTPAMAVDGVKNNANNHWAGLELPNALTIDMQKTQKINTIALWTYWPGERTYKYRIEGSDDKKQWTMLADRTKNSSPSKATGDVFRFKTQSLRYVRVTMTDNSAGKQNGGHVCEIEGYYLEKEPTVKTSNLTWEKLATDGLAGSFVSVDRRYGRQRIPEITAIQKQAKLTAWRGERVHTQIALFSRGGVKQVRLSTTDGAPLKSSAMFLRYTGVLGKLYPDIIDPIDRLDIPAKTTRSVWVTVNVPENASAGEHTVIVKALAKNGNSITLPLTVEVKPITLPNALEWDFHLDLWQNPYSIARWHGVEPWSDAHFAMMKPYYELLAQTGQKCLTVSLLHQPWGAQTYDPFEGMVEWIKKPNGTWTYDFTIFDRYVEAAEKWGFTDRINCYSMCPWSNRFRYVDAASGDYQTISAKPGSDEYEAHWTPFLKAFEKHLKQKGWLGRVAIAMDERPDAMMKKVIDMINDTAPSLMVASATNHAPKEFKIHDWSAILNHPYNPEVVAKRAADPMLETTFYVCTGPRVPNTFTFSPPAESTWLGHFAAAEGLSGFLRWAYNSWTEDPFFETKYPAKGWPSGDCYLVYPGPRSSLRFERLREGIQDYEKIRILRNRAAKDRRPAVKATLKELDEALEKYSYNAVQSTPAENFVNPTKNAMEALTDALLKR